MSYNIVENGKLKSITSSGTTTIVEGKPIYGPRKQYATNKQMPLAGQASLKYTMDTDGILTGSCHKAGQGYSAWMHLNGKLITTFDNYGGESCSFDFPNVRVKTGDVIELTTNVLTTETTNFFWLNNIGVTPIIGMEPGGEIEVDTSFDLYTNLDSFIDPSKNNTKFFGAYNGGNSYGGPLTRMAFGRVQVQIASTGTVRCIQTLDYSSEGEETHIYSRTGVYSSGAWSWGQWIEYASYHSPIKQLINLSTDILAFAKTCPISSRTMVRVHSTNAANNPYSVTTDTDFIYTIDKINDSEHWITVHAKDVRSNRTFTNTHNDQQWIGWQEFSYKA